MRIVAGTARGRPIEGPKNRQGIRPTADRVRETLFNVLGQYLDGGEVLDLFAGTGALALEALSRGAGAAILVDRDREAAALCRENAASLGFGSQVTVLQTPVAQALASLARAGRAFVLIFVDPPYALEAGVSVLVAVDQGSLLLPGGTLVLEHDKREAVPEVSGSLVQVDQRSFGDTRVTFYRHRDERAA